MDHEKHAEWEFLVRYAPNASMWPPKIPAGLCAFNFEQFSHCQAVFPQNEFNFQYQIYSSTTTAAAASEWTTLHDSNQISTDCYNFLHRAHRYVGM